MLAAEFLRECRVNEDVEERGMFQEGTAREYV